MQIWNPYSSDPIRDTPPLARPRATIAIWLLCFSITLLYILSMPPWTESDTANLIVYFNMFIKGRHLATDAGTVPQLLPILVDGILWNLAPHVRVLQLASATAFATALTCAVVAVSRLAGALAGCLALAGILSSTRIMLIVMWGRSPVWAFLLLSIALLLFLRHPATEKRMHLILLLSLGAVCCRTDLIGLHGMLTALAVLDAASGRHWTRMLRLSLWGLGLLVPPVTDLIVAGTPFYTRLVNVYFGETREAYHMAMHGHGVPMPPRPASLALIRRGMRVPGHLFAYSYGLLAIPALVVFWHRSRKAAGAVLLITFSIALPGIVLALNGFYAARSFILLHAVLALLSAIGTTTLIEILCRNRRRALAAGLAIACAVMLLHAPAWRDHVRNTRKQAVEFHRHDRLAQRLAALPEPLVPPLIVEPPYLRFLYMLRLDLEHGEVISKYDLAHRLYNGVRLPETLTWIASEPPEARLPFVEIKAADKLLEHEGIMVTTCHLGAIKAK